jgi:hypothetical protein
LDVSQSGAVAVTVVVPELTQSAQPTPLPPAAEEPDSFVTPEGYPRVAAWSLSMLLALVGSGALFAIASQFLVRKTALRLALGMVLGGLLAYNLLAFGIFDLAGWLAEAGMPGVLTATLIGQLLGLAGGWVWSRSGK